MMVMCRVSACKSAKRRISMLIYYITERQRDVIVEPRLIKSKIMTTSVNNQTGTHLKGREKILPVSKVLGKNFY